MDFDNVSRGGRASVQVNNVDGGCGPRLVGMGDRKLYVPDGGRSSGPGCTENGLFVTVDIC